MEDVAIELTAASWCPASIQVLDRLVGLEHDVVVRTIQPVEAWQALQARPGWQALRFVTDEDAVELGQLSLVRGEQRLWEIELWGQADSRFERVLDAFASTDPLSALQALPEEASPREIEALASSPNLREVRRAAELLPEEPDVRWTDTVNALAWRLATDERGRRKDRALAIALAERSLAHGGAGHALLLDTHARALWELGRREEALAQQALAVQLAPRAQDLAETLAQYREAMGNTAPPAPWTGTLNEAWERGAFTLVFPEGEEWTKEADWLAEKLQKKVVRVGQAAKGDLLALYGTPEQNPLTAEVLAHHRVRFTETGVTIGSTALQIEAPVLIVALPSPWVPGGVVVVYTARAPEHARSLNGLFHGPTPLALGTRTGPRPEGVGQLGLTLDAEGRVQALDAATGPLTTQQALEDLHALDDLLRETYSGFADLELRVGSWQEHSERTQARLRERDAWPWHEFARVLVEEHLAGVQDTHFHLYGGAVADGQIGELSAQLVQPLTPWFTELRLDAQGRVVRGPEALVGQDLGELAVPEPGTAQAGVPYRFPTLLPDGSPAFLVGTFGSSPERPADLSLRETALPLHRARFEPRDGPWAQHDGEVPVLAVRTMMESRLDGLAQTAPSLRSHRELVLDLRANGGGSDAPAAAWVVGLSPGRYRSAGGALVERGAWSCWTPGTYEGKGDPWSGKLYVLIDRGVASSGETFALLASQVPGAVLVGESTAGCTENGNVTEHGPLPHSRLRLRFGYTRFAWEVVRPLREGVGLFPELWLDEADPVSFLSQLP